MAEENEGTSGGPEALHAKIDELQTHILRQRREIRRLRKKLHQQEALAAERSSVAVAQQNEDPVDLTAADLLHLHAVIKGRVAA